MGRGWGALLVAALALGAPLAAALVAQAVADRPRGLEYDAVERVQVGSFAVQIETRSFALGHGDNGPAELIVTTSAGAARIESRFNSDLFMDLRPAYLTWREVDASPGADLLIWRPGAGDLVAAEYVSSADGLLHRLPAPLARPLE